MTQKELEEELKNGVEKTFDHFLDVAYEELEEKYSKGEIIRAIFKGPEPEINYDFNFGIVFACKNFVFDFLKNSKDFTKEDFENAFKRVEKQIKDPIKHLILFKITEYISLRVY